MPLRLSARAAVVALAVAAASVGVAASASAATAATDTPLPAHVFAPYFEAYNGDSLSGLATASGNKYLTMAFIQTPTAGSCTADWNGDASTPISAADYGSDIASIQAGGGNVIPSFGGYSADHGGTDIADSCTDVADIAAAYESVATTYNVSRIDLDIEDNSLTDTAGITRRNQAVAQAEAWATANGRTLQFSYTMPTESTGLDSTGVAVLKNAVAEGARVDVANIMTFDYYYGTKQEMATDTESAGAGLVKQLAGIYPSKTTAQLWDMVGITEMVGIDDYGADETFTTADAATVLAWAKAQGVNTLSFWALQRDNGGCVGTGGSDSCSGIAQSTWQFSNAFEPFSGGTTTVGNDFSLSASPSSGSVTAGGSATATVGTAVASGSAESVALTASGAPSGATVAFSPSPVTSGSSSTMTVSTTSATASGSYPITVTGTAASGSHSTTYTLTVGSGGSTGGKTYPAASATLGGSADANSCSACAGGEKVSSIGGGGAGTVTFTGVSDAAAGSYTMTVSYLSVGEAKPAVITVNGVARTVSFPETSASSYSVIGTLKVTVTLKAGSSNTIEFSGSGTKGAPDLSTIAV